MFFLLNLPVAFERIDIFDLIDLMRMKKEQEIRETKKKKTIFELKTCN